MEKLIMDKNLISHSGNSSIQHQGELGELQLELWR